MNFKNLIVSFLLMMPTFCLSQYDELLQSILPIYKPESKTFELTYVQAQNMDYWARRGLYAENNKNYLIRLIDQVVENNIEADSFTRNLNVKYFKLSESFQTLQLDYNDLDNKFKNATNTNIKLNDKLNIYESENGTLRRSKNTAWLIAAGEAVLLGVLVGVLVSK